MLKESLINCDFEFKSTFMLTFPHELIKGKSPAEQIDIATDKFAKLRLIIYKEIKEGNLHIKSFDYFLCWEYRPNTGDIHAHMLTNSFIKKHTMTKLVKRAGMGEYNYLQGINKSGDPAYYRQKVKYAAKYVYKGGWNVVQGRRRYSMSKSVSESVNRWIRDNKKPFNGEIVSHEEIALINKSVHVEVLGSTGAARLVNPGYYLYESPIKLDMGKIWKMETWDPRYRKQPKKRVRQEIVIEPEKQMSIPFPILDDVPAGERKRDAGG